MRIPNSRGIYRHSQTFPLSVCGSFMLQKSTIVPITKKKSNHMLEWLEAHCSDPSSESVLRNSSETTSCSVLPASLDPLQFAYRSNRSTDDAIAFTMHTALSHLENKNTYVRMLFVDYRSAFNTIVPATLVARLQSLELNRSLCSWILDFLPVQLHTAPNLLTTQWW